MILLEILSGKLAGTRYGARRFPLRIGRAPQSSLRVEEPGVWDSHAEIRFQRGSGFHASATGDALLRVNGESQTSVRLRTGDVLELGTARIRFWLGEPVQRPLCVREYGAWLLIAAMIFGQVALIYRLL